LAGEAVPRPIMIDCSHGNSGKDPARQVPVFREVLAQVRAGEESVMGLLVESNLVHGRQDWKPGASLTFGQSITDACLGWPEAEELLREAAPAVEAAPVR